MAKTKSATASKSSGSKPAEVKSFTGTSTGSKYNVGQEYSTSRGTVVAQSDGTFRNKNTGQVSAGSSEAVSEARQLLSKGRSDSGNASEGYSGGKQTVKVGFGSGPGTGSVGTPGASRVPQKGAGAAKVASGAGFFSGVASNIETQLLYWGGKRLNTRLDISDGGDFEQRWGEWGGAMAGLAVMGSDLGNMATSELARQRDAVLKMHADAGKLNIQTNAQGKPHGMTDQNWLEQKLRQYAEEERLTRMHETGLGAVFGNPFKGEGAWGNWVQ